MTVLTREMAETFAGLALSHISREFPYKMDHVLTGLEDAVVPRSVHPIFFGSFDWHSCVHGFWTMARLVRRQPEIAAAARIRDLFAERITEPNVAGEVAYLARPLSRGFERPYGWGWLLALQAELELHEGDTIAEAGLKLRPLTEAFAQRFRDFLPLADYPVRTGVHSSTAFAMPPAARGVRKLIIFRR